VSGAVNPTNVFFGDVGGSMFDDAGAAMTPFATQAYLRSGWEAARFTAMLVEICPTMLMAATIRSPQQV
jgi:hypothetical protein